MSSSHPNHGIARIELNNSNTFGFQVRLQRQGHQVAKFFADRHYHGPNGALTAARHWRDQALAQLARQYPSRSCKKSPRNSSGVVGVSKIRIRTNGSEYLFWQASWTCPNGQRKSVKFSIQKYGNQQAYSLAVKTRHNAITK